MFTNDDRFNLFKEENSVANSRSECVFLLHHGVSSCVKFEVLMLTFILTVSTKALPEVFASSCLLVQMLFHLMYTVVVVNPSRSKQNWAKSIKLCPLKNILHVNMPIKSAKAQRRRDIIR
ncbi:hypothetical protein AVEN_120993-1 [Araneus ventricosus]|uniref:Uncharacterized protein n=1 Tax=Araneus ventricosus TaxID=182803 RepID=A0A4Y2HFN8_ARAVE|nr:hypothetical protein AVEN_120993-1 [Araneus ventricosus]